MQAVYLPEAPVYRLEGDLVIVTSNSGDETFVKVLTINQFMAAHNASTKIIKEWVALSRRNNMVAIVPHAASASGRSAK